MVYVEIWAAGQKPTKLPFDAGSASEAQRITWHLRNLLPVEVRDLIENGGREGRSEMDAIRAREGLSEEFVYNAVARLLGRPTRA